MAVARHSENIEVQDEDQDDYENVPVITARRTNVEVSEEGHYECLDLQKKDDAVYEDLRTKPRKRPKGAGLPKSERRPLRVVPGCLVMLCLILLGMNIAQAVLYRSTCSNCMTNDIMVHDNNTLKSINDTLTLEFSQLKSDNTILNREKDLLTTSNTNLLREKNQLQSEVNQLKTKIADKSCPSGWTKFGCSCYHLTSIPKTWQEGGDYCLTQGAHLVVINSREEQEFINGLSPRDSTSWIGLNRTEGRWMWVDGTPLTTTQYWTSGWPNNDEDKNCAGHWTRHGELFNGLCSAMRLSICEN